MIRSDNQGGFLYTVMLYADSGLVYKRFLRFIMLPLLQFADSKDDLFSIILLDQSRPQADRNRFSIH